jgi:hypothetical protein
MHPCLTLHNLLESWCALGKEEFILQDIASDQVRRIKANIDQDLADILGFASIGLSPDGQYLAVGPYDPLPGLDGLPALLVSKLPAPLAETLQPQSSRSIRVYGTSDGCERLRLPGERGMFSPDGGTLLVINQRLAREEWGAHYVTEVNLYDVPFRGPRHQALLLGLLAGALTYALAPPWSRSSRRCQVGPIPPASQGAS